VGGPSGSGKSEAFPVAQISQDRFNVDDRCKELNGDSYLAIPKDVRDRANKECEVFIADHIRDRRGFAIETTLRSDVTFRQAAAAHANGFRVELRYIATGSVEENVARVADRARLGGHSASPGKIRAIYAASLANLPRAIREFDRVRVYDNTPRKAERVRLVLEAYRGRVKYAAPDIPDWLRGALRRTEYERALAPAPKAHEGPGATQRELDKTLDTLSKRVASIAEKATTLSPETAAKAAGLAPGRGDDLPDQDPSDKKRDRGSGPQR
jgi:predicted ABC-type ATPase